MVILLKELERLKEYKSGLSFWEVFGEGNMQCSVNVKLCTAQYQKCNQIALKSVDQWLNDILYGASSQSLHCEEVVHEI